ncbi:MAG: hypothetical protein M1453_09330 [Acidobacteria bacterium]|nr:hypothetical protein [Acidobacteriota bacterium]MCL5288178.1 hypothetical protein [Acidobacteriota bacterium]
MANVALVARIPESVSLSAGLQPAPAVLQGNGARASILVVQSIWHMAFGRSVTLAAQLEAGGEPLQSAALIPLRKAGEPLDARDIPAFSFLERRLPSSISLLDNVDPRKGRQAQLHGLLVLHPSNSAASPQVVLLTVTAI